MSCKENYSTLSSLGTEMTWEIKQGATFIFEGQLFSEGTTGTIEDIDGNLVYVGPPIDITGCSIRCHIRKKGLDTGTPPVTATGTVVDGAEGIYRVAATDEQTTAIECGEKMYDRASAYTADVFLDWPGGDVWELVHANVFVLRRVTKS